MSGPRPTLGLEEFRANAHALALARRKARQDFELRSVEQADAEREYRKAQAIAYAEARADGCTNAEAEIRVAGATADLRRARDIAKSQAKSAQLRIEELEADRTILRDVGDWSRAIDGVVT